MLSTEAQSERASQEVTDGEHQGVKSDMNAMLNREEQKDPPESCTQIQSLSNPFFLKRIHSTPSISPIHKHTNKINSIPHLLLRVGFALRFRQ